MKREDIHKRVRNAYGQVATRQGGCGCGNPVALASLREGEVVLDQGSGGGSTPFLRRSGSARRAASSAST